MVSPGHPSTDLTSTSAAEEFHRFKCQAPDCSKSYKDSGGLKSHVDVSDDQLSQYIASTKHHQRVHPSTELFENFKCAVKDCTKSYPTREILNHHVEVRC